MITAADLRAAFPNFVDLTDAVINPAITAAGPFFNDPGRYAEFLVDAQLNCVAHFVLIRNPTRGTDRGANDITMEDRPTLKFSRDAKLLQRQASDPFQMTDYGRMYAYYRDRAGLGGAAAAISSAAAPALLAAAYAGDA